MRFVICEPGPQANAWHMPATTLTPRTWVSGGQRTLYGLAAALAATGREVELRGEICPDAAAEIFEAARAVPRFATTSRRPEAGEAVISSIGLRDPLHFARLALSDAVPVLMMMDPPGLFGWPFVEQWELPDPTTVDLETLARPEHFQAMQGLGFRLWSNNERLVDRARLASVECTLVGLAQALTVPTAVPLADRRHDVAVIRDNRWHEFAKPILADLVDLRVIEIEGGTRDDLLRQLGHAKVLLWPSRVEGHARIQCEARSVGTVPVALDNPFGVGLTEEAGSVVVSSTDAMAGAIRELLLDPSRLEQLSERGIDAVRRAESWPDFVERVDAAAEQLERARPIASLARSGEDIERVLAAPLVEFHQAATQRYEDLLATQETLRATEAELQAQHAEVQAEREAREALAAELLRVRNRTLIGFARRVMRKLGRVGSRHAAP